MFKNKVLIAIVFVALIAVAFLTCVVYEKGLKESHFDDNFHGQIPSLLRTVDAIRTYFILESRNIKPQNIANKSMNIKLSACLSPPLIVPPVAIPIKKNANINKNG